jgi:hypothetical protein
METADTPVKLSSATHSAIAALVVELRDIHSHSSIYATTNRYRDPFRIRLTWSRQLYYQLKHVYKNQEIMKLAILPLALHARVSPTLLGVVSEARGCVKGCAEIVRRNTTIDERITHVQDATRLSAVTVIQTFNRDDRALDISRECRGLVLVESEVSSHGVCKAISNCC